MILLATLEVVYTSTEGCVEDRHSCADYFSETIENMYHQLNGKKTLCRFLAHKINISMSLYLCRKRLYDNLIESGLLCLPHPNTLKKITKSSKVKLGSDPKIYLPSKEPHA